MKHVWILNHYAQEPGGAGGTRHFSLARHLSRYGWRATILAASVDHATGVQRLGDSETKRYQIYNDVPFLWLKTRDYSGNGISRVGNMLDYTRAVLNSKNLSELDPPDIVVGSSVHPLAAWAGRKLAKRYGVPFVFEVRDLWPQTLIDMGRISSRHPAALGLRWLEKSLYRDAARIIVLLPHADKYIEPLGIDRKKIEWVPNGVELDIFPHPEPKLSGDSFTLMYFGAHGAANGLDNLLRAMKILDGKALVKRIGLRIIGDGPLKPALIAMAGEMGLSNVSFEPPVPKRQIAGLAAEADAFIFNLIDAPVFKYGISSNKLFDFMACGRPVVFSCDASNNPVEAAGGGVTVPAGKPDILAEAMITLSMAPEATLQAMGEANRSHIEANYEFNILGRKFASILDAARENT